MSGLARFSAPVQPDRLFEQFRLADQERGDSTSIDHHLVGNLEFGIEQHHVQISMASQGAPEENPYAECLIRTIKEKEVDLSEYQAFGDALAQIGYFIDDMYQKKRIHSALGYLTPVESESAYWMMQLEQMSSLNLP